MLIYELITFGTAILTSMMLGVFGVTAYQVYKIRKEGQKRVDEFAKVTKEASEANVSMGTMLTDMSHRLDAVSERMSMIQGNVNQGAKQWQSTKR